MITRKELLRQLEIARKNVDTEAAHADADQALLDYISDDEISDAFDRVEKWYG